MDTDLKLYIKNIDPKNVSAVAGNTGNNFPFQNRQIPQKTFYFCYLSVQENREVFLATEDNDMLYIDCL